MDAQGDGTILDRLAALERAAADFRAPALSARLAALQRDIERAYPLTLALDLVNREAFDELPPEISDTLHAVVAEAVLNAARHGHAALIWLSLQLNGGTVLLAIADDGRGFPFSGVYDLRALEALDAGPRRLKELVGALGGTMTLDSRVTGTRIDIALPRAMSQPNRVRPARQAA